MPAFKIYLEQGNRSPQDYLDDALEVFYASPDNWTRVVIARVLMDLGYTTIQAAHAVAYIASQLVIWEQEAKSDDIFDFLAAMMVEEAELLR